MQTITVTDWANFEANLQEIKRSINPGPIGWLFRGQADSSWSLQTTLERSLGTTDKVIDYYTIIRRIRPMVETFTGHNFETPEQDEVMNFAHDYDLFSRRLTAGNLPAYRYMIYLCHHGFPSPLLDWSRSPYVAAYFGFAKASAEYVSIYVFAERPEQMKTRGAGETAIYSFGPLVTSHKRHFLQQSTYTICAKYPLPGGRWQFSSHEEVFALTDRQQDLLWRFVIPSVERIKVLRFLDEFNLNALSLFGSEESLLETLEIREMYFRDP